MTLISNRSLSRRSALAACLLAAALSAHAAGVGGVGLNLGGFEIYTAANPMVNLMKQSGEWLTQCDSWRDGKNCANFASGASGWDTQEQSKLSLDAQGWPTRLPAADDNSVKYRKVSTMIFAHGKQQAGRYVVTYEGSGTLVYNGVGSKVVSESRPGRDVIDVKAGNAGMWLSIEATDPNNHLRNIRIYAPGGSCGSTYSVYAASASDCVGKGAFVPFENFPESQQFNPQFVNDLRGFSVLRFLDWSHTNYSTLENWADRPLRSDRTWATNAGVPIGVMMSLARKVGADPWLTLPGRANDDYVRRFARQAKTSLAAGAKLYVEYGNEPWNGMFPNMQYMLDQAKQQWGKVPGVSDYSLVLNWYAQRSVQVCNIVKSEFGADAKRVVCVANGQAANSWGSDYMLQCPVAAKSLGSSCGAQLDALAIAPYFGYYLGDAKHYDTLLKWTRLPDGGLSKVFEELTGKNAAGQKVTPPLAAEGSGAPQGAIAQSAEWMRASKAVASAHGLPLIAYEGGQHLTGVGAPEAINDMLAKANRDPRMGGAYAQTHADWRAAGGQLYVYFNHVAGESQWGSWGLKLFLEDVDAPKWVEVVKQRAQSCWWSNCASQP